MRWSLADYNVNANAAAAAATAATVQMLGLYRYTAEIMILDFNFRWQYYVMSEPGAVPKRTSLCELLDEFVDAQRLDIKAYCSGHLNESKLYHPPSKASSSLWPGHNRSSVSVPDRSAKSQKKVNRNNFGDGRTRQHYNLKPLKSEKLPKCIRTVGSKNMSCSGVQTLSTRDSQEAGLQVSLDDCMSVEELHVPSDINSKSKTASKLFHTAYAADIQQPSHGIHLPSIDLKHSEAATKNDQFRKMRDYHNNVIQHPTYVRQHAVTGCDTVKYLEHRLNKV